VRGRRKYADERQRTNQGREAQRNNPCVSTKERPPFLGGVFLVMICLDFNNLIFCGAQFFPCCIARCGKPIIYHG
jgi:hypothetical protein